MTGQIPDTCNYNGRRYDVVGISGGPLPSPEDFGLRLVAASTGCWRGYILRLSVKDGRLMLAEMGVGHAPDGYRPINGSLPQADEYGAMSYRGLGLALSFSGRLTLAADFIQERYIHMGYQSAESYRTVLELDFAGGALSGERDLSADMACLRELGDSAGGEGEPQNPLHWIERSIESHSLPDDDPPEEAG